MLLLLIAVGVGPAAFLPRTLPAAARLALVPALGLAACVSLLVTVNYVVPLRYAFWFAVLPAAMISVAVAVLRLRRGAGARAGAPRLRELVQIAVLVLGVLLVYDAPLDQRFSTGPIAYDVPDAPGYLACVRGFEVNRNDEPLGNSINGAFGLASDETTAGPAWNLSAKFCDAFKFQHLGSMTLPSSLVSPTGWRAWELVTPYMALLALMTALGCYALFRTLVRSAPAWLAVVAGGAGAGAPIFQGYLDGSAGLLSATALTPALLVVAVAAFEGSVAACALAGLLGAGVQTCYPEAAPVVLTALVLALAARGLRHRRAGGGAARAVRVAGPRLLLAAVLALALSPRAIFWTVANAKFARQVNDSQGSLPSYNVVPKTILGWLTQTREFYSFAYSAPRGVAFAVVGVLIPLALVAVAGFGAVRRPALRAVALVVVAAIAQSAYLNVSTGCTYCVDRTMLIAAPFAAVSIVGGLSLLTGAGTRQLATGLGAVATLLAAGSVLRLEQRAERGAYMPAKDLGSMTTQISRHVDGTLQLEGFAATPKWAYSDTPVVYDAAQEATPHRISMIPVYDDYGGLTYLRTRPVGHPAYTVDYEYVLSRLGGLDSGRELVARTATMKLERRRGPFDVVVARGIGVNTYERDPSGAAWLQNANQYQGPLTFWVAARSPAAAYVRAVVAAPPGVVPQRQQQRAVRIRRLPGGRVELCLPAVGSGALRVGTVALAGISPAPAPPANGPFDQETADERAAPVTQEALLEKVGASSAPC